uniref:Uncharacterized protein n=1 Tax=Panagrolaimus superbus TaxID=310955 RepID=A0A914ZDK1_9BILA
MSSSTLVPFTSREWQIVQNLYNKNGNDLVLATEILSMWRIRQGSNTPVIFQITDHLLHIDRLYQSTNFKDDFSVKTLLNNYSTVLVRLVF